MNNIDFSLAFHIISFSLLCLNFLLLLNEREILLKCITIFMGLLFLSYFLLIILGYVYIPFKNTTSLVLFFGIIILYFIYVIIYLCKIFWDKEYVNTKILVSTFGTIMLMSILEIIFIKTNYHSWKGFYFFGLAVLVAVLFVFMAIFEGLKLEDAYEKYKIAREEAENG